MSQCTSFTVSNPDGVATLMPVHKTYQSLAAWWEKEARRCTNHAMDYHMAPNCLRIAGEFTELAKHSVTL